MENLLPYRSTSRSQWILLALVAILGFVGCGTTHTNSAPEFSDITLTRSVAENTAAGSNIGDVIPPATDADADDTLTYTMEGTDASSFTFDTSFRQIKTKSGVTYDYESKSSYSVTIKVSDGEASDTVGVTINITDVAEVPAKPAAPTVSGASTTSLSVVWSAPTNTGKPAITSYDLTYRAGSSGSWSNGPQNVTATSATISNLNSGTSYQVRVRATNDEGNGPWSAATSGTTTEPSPPAASSCSSRDEPWLEDFFCPSADFYQYCADLSKAVSQDAMRGTYVDENNWLRSWSHETYLWYDEIEDVNPACCTDPTDYFQLMKTTQTTPSGKDKDRFHFTRSTEEHRLSTQGIAYGYGAEFVLLRAAPPRDVRIAYTEPGSPATAPEVNLSRGARILEIDGERMLDSSNIAVLNNGLSPRTAGESHTFTVLDLGSQTPRTVTMTSAAITSHPVQNVDIITTPSGDRVGYMLFNAHSAPAAQAIIKEGKYLKDAGIDDLIVDLRYNAGGLLYVAQIFSSMVAGTEKEGLVFEELQTNGKISLPGIWNFALEYAAGRDVLDDVDLTVPSLGLPRLFVLTSFQTASASESIINGLRGVDIDVIQIGSVTRGKPYGFRPTPNCGIYYYSINFRGINAKGEADFEDGFTPHCQVAEDFNHMLGNPEEILLKTALAYRADGTCPATEEESGRASVLSAESSSGEAISKPSGLSDKIVESEMSPLN